MMLSSKLSWELILIASMCKVTNQDHPLVDVIGPSSMTDMETQRKIKSRTTLSSWQKQLLRDLKKYPLHLENLTLELWAM